MLLSWFALFFLFLTAKQSVNKIKGRHLEESKLIYEIGTDVQISQIPNESLFSDQPTARATLSNGNFVIIWQRINNRSKESYILGQIMDYNLKLINNTFSVSSEGTNLFYKTYAAIDSFSSEGFVICWQINNTITNYDIFCRIYYDNMGKNQSEEFIIHDYKTKNQMHPKIKTLAFPSFIVVWESEGQDGDGLGVYGNIFNGTTPKNSSKEKPLTTYTKSDQGNPDLCILSNGLIIITWYSYGEITIDGGDAYDIFANYFDNDLNILGTEFMVNEKDVSWQEFGMITTLNQLSFVIVWMSWTRASQYNFIAGRIFTFNNATSTIDATTNEFVISSTAIQIDDIFYPIHSVTSLKGDDGEIEAFVAVYGNSVSKNKNYGFNFQILDLQGNKISQGINYGTDKNPLNFPSFAIDIGNESFAIVWPAIYDSTNSLSKIMAKKYTFSQQLFKNNYFNVTQTKTVQISSNNLKSEVADYVKITEMKHCYFIHNKISTILFTMDDVENGEIFLVPDGGINAPYFEIEAKKFGSSLVLGKVVANVSFEMMPISSKFDILENSLNFSYGEKIQLTEKNIQLICLEQQNCSLSSLNVLIIDTLNAQLEFIYQPNIAIKSFTYSQLLNNEIVLVSERTLSSPIYSVVATDGETITKPLKSKVILKQIHLEPTTKTEFRITNDTVWDHFLPTAVSKSSGEYTVVWESDGQDGSGAGIYLQNFDSHNKKIGKETFVNSISSANSQCNPSAVYDGNDNLIVAWTDNNGGRVCLSYYYNVEKSISLCTNIVNSDEAGLYTHLTVNNNNELALTYYFLYENGYQINFQRFKIKTESLEALESPFIPYKNFSTTQEKPCTILLNNGDYVMVWQQKDLSYSLGYDIYIFFSGSVPKMVNNYSYADQLNPKIIQLYDQGYFVIWQSPEQDGSGYGIFGKKYFENGTENGQEFQINSFNLGDQQNPSISISDRGEIIVVWESDNQDGSKTGIYGQRFDASVKRIGSEFQLNTYTTNRQNFPSVTLFPNGCFMAVWQSFQQDTFLGTYSIYGIQFCLTLPSSEILKEASEFQVIQADIYTLNEDNLKMALGIFNSGNALIAWSEHRFNGSSKQYTDYNWTIYAQIIDKFSNKVGDNFMVSLNLTEKGSGIYPSLGIADDNSFVITWFGSGPGYENGQDDDIYARCYDSLSRPIPVNFSLNISESIFRVNTKTIKNQRYQKIAMNKKGRFVIVWASFDDNPAIYGQIFENCTKIGENFLVDYIPKQNYPYISIDIKDSGDFLVAWRHNTNTDNLDHSWGQYFYSNGQKIDEKFEIFSTLSGKGPCLNFLNQNGYVVSLTNFGGDKYYHGIFAQIFDDNRNQITKVFQVNTYFFHDQSYSAIGVFSNDNFLVLWSSDGADGSDDAIEAQFYDSNGVPIGSEFTVNTQDLEDQIFAEISINSADEAIVVWYSNNRKNKGIFGQRFRLFTNVMDSSDDSSSEILGVEIIKEFINANNPVSFAVSEDELYVWKINMDGQLDIYDKIRDEDYLNLNRSFNNFTQGQIVSMIKFKEILCIANKTLIFFLNISNPIYPILENTISLEKDLRKMHIYEGYLYIASKSGLFAYSIIVEKTINIFFIKAISNESYISDFLIYQKKVYMLIEFKSILIYFEIDDNFTVIAGPIEYGLNSAGKSLEITKNGSYLLVGTAGGLHLFDLKKTYFTKSYEINSVNKIHFSENDNFLSICNNQYHLFYNSKNIENLILLENTTFSSHLIDSTITKDNCYIFIICEGLHFLKILSRDSGDSKLIAPSVTGIGKTYIQNPKFNSVVLSEDENTAFVSDNYDYISAFDISDLNSSSFQLLRNQSGFGNVINMKFYSNKLYFINGSGLYQYLWDPSQNELIFSLFFDLKQTIELIFSIDLNYIYVGTYSTLYIITSKNFQLIQIISLDLNYDGMIWSLAISEGNDFIFLAMDLDGLAYIKLENFTKPTNVKKFYVGEEVYDVKIIKKDNKNIILSSGGRNLRIFELTSDSEELLLLSQVYIAQNTDSFRVINNNYIALQGDNIISLLQITDLEAPIRMEYYQLNYPNPGYYFFLFHDNKYAIFPTMEVISFYYGDLKLYSFITMRKFNGNKQFDIKIYGLSMKTGNSVSKLFKILKINIQRIQPSWISYNLDKKIISIFPSDINDLIIFTQLLIEITASMAIDTILLPTEELTNLKVMGIIDLDMFPTKKFYDSSKLLTNNQKNVLSHHLFVQKLFFPLNSFLSLNSPPEIIIPLQFYFEKENFQKNWVVVGKKIDIQIPLINYLDPDDDLISFSVDFNFNSSFNWLNFDSQTRRFYGIPTKNHKNTILYAKIIISDGYSIQNDTLNITVLKNQTIFSKNGDASNNLFNINGFFIYNLPYNYKDVDGDDLTYSVKYINKNSLQELPYWISFDDSKMQLRGTVETKYIQYHQEKKLYYQVFKLLLFVKNIADDVITTNFSLIFKNSSPKINNKKLLKDQFFKKCENELGTQYLQVEIYFDISFDKDSFIDDNVNATLSYTAHLNVNSALPEWILFDPENFKLIFNPTEQNLNEYYTITLSANNGIQVVKQSLTFKVGLSWIYILKLLAKIIGPFIAVLGLFKKRSYIYHYFCKSHYQFRKIIVQSNDTLIKDFYLIEEYLRIGYFLYLYLMKDEMYQKNPNMIGRLLFSKDKNRFSQVLKEKLLSIKKEAKQKKDLNIFRGLDEELCDPDNTLFTIIEAFLTEKLISSNSYAKKIYKMMKKKFKSQYMKNWYDSFVIIIDHKRYLKHELFPQVDINILFLKNEIIEIEKEFLKACHFCRCLRKPKKALDENDLQLICLLIKKDALGIPETPKRWYHFLERARGESILIPTNDIQEINCKRVFEVGKGCTDKIKAYLSFNYSNLEISNNKKLPCWLDYEITLGVLRFSGRPTEIDQGTYVIDILDINGIIIKQFEIMVVESHKSYRRTEKKALKSSINLRQIVVEKQESPIETEHEIEFKDLNKQNFIKSFKIPKDGMKQHSKIEINSPTLEMTNFGKNNSKSFSMNQEEIVKKLNDDNSDRSELNPFNGKIFE